MQQAFANTRVFRSEGKVRLVEILFELSDQGQVEPMLRVKDLATGEEYTAFGDELS